MEHLLENPNHALTDTETNNNTHEYLIAYSEIALKGTNRIDFIRQLKNQIKKSCKIHGVNIRSSTSISNHLVYTFEGDPAIIESLLSRIFGIEYFSRIHKIPEDPEHLFRFARKLFSLFASQGIKEINIQIKRIDKSFPLTSGEILEKLRHLAGESNIRISFQEKERVIYFKIYSGEIWCYTQKNRGAGGLPVSPEKKTLALLSGGIDSPVAAYLTMKRGARVDFLHFHTFSKGELVLQSKILKTIEILNRYQFYSNLYLVPHFIFDLEILGKIDSGYELIVFKHFLLKIAEIIAKEHGYFAIITGDSLAQVASQTLENLYATSYGIEIPVFRPLIGYDKKEIVSLAKVISTYDISLQKYKDCCSLFARQPKTRVKREKLLSLLEKINWEKILKESLQRMEVYFLTYLKSPGIYKIR